MKNLAIAAGLAAGLATTAFGLASPSNAAPAGPGSARAAISELEQLGNRVIVRRLSDTPLSVASVVSVQPGVAIRESVWNADHFTAALQPAGRIVYMSVR